MQVFPAIDLRGGRCVRLLRGDYAQETVYGDDPLAMAQKLVRAGARWIHVVDLDGARSGVAENLRAIEAMASCRCASRPAAVSAARRMSTCACAWAWRAACWAPRLWKTRR